jgi:tRNA pseudouridine38-40 synthase
MTRFALQLEYDGTGYVGWQRQAVGQSLQKILEEAAGKLSDHPVASVTAGRTDAGVHATGQVVHIDLMREIAPDALARALNYHMKPHLLVVRQAAIVEPKFSARFSAIGRHYRYVILNRMARPAVNVNAVWQVSAALDVDAMHEAAQQIVGTNDFTSFRASSCQAKSPIRTLDVLTVTRDGEVIEIIAHARSFLHHQVRNMTGTLKLVGEGKLRPGDMTGILAAKHRAAAGPTAPPQGLTLTKVVYEVDPFAANSNSAKALISGA